MRRDVIALVSACALLAGACSSAASPAVREVGGAAEAPTGPAASGSGSEEGNWVEQENANPGTPGWADVNTPEDGVSGYADRTSAVRGDEVRLFVSTEAPTFKVEAYRVGYYGGVGGRLIWTSPEVSGLVQPDGTRDPSTNLIEARWQPSTTVDIGDDWPPGMYLLKYQAADASSSFTPLVIRDESSNAPLAMVSDVTTFQAYNSWGGCSLYACPGIKGQKRAKVVSFDRPYSLGGGASDFLGFDAPLVSLVEELGLDVSYWSNLDMEERSELVVNDARTALLSLGHDEYYSRPMRDLLVRARDSGVNLAFFGANAIYRKIRWEPSWDGRPNRRMVNYRDKSDPINKTDPEETSTQWRVPPLSEPENEIVGIQYECAPMKDDIRIVDASAWIFEGTGITDGTVLPNIEGAEYDRWFPGSPENLQILAHSPVTCGGKSSFADMSYWSTPSGGGVFASGTIRWICAIARNCGPEAPVSPETAAKVKAVTTNIVREFAEPKAGERFPSVPNASKYWPAAKSKSS